MPTPAYKPPTSAEEPGKTDSTAADRDQRLLIDPEAESRFHDRVRFGCGAMLGALLGLLSVGRLEHLSGWVVAGAMIVGAIACGIASLKQGDRFWVTPPLDDGFRWWWRW